jgi:hypothetical protein
MIIQAALPASQPTPKGPLTAAAPKSSEGGTEDHVEVDFKGNRPAHRDVKKMARGAAALVGAAGIGKAAFDLITSPSLETGLLKAALSLGVTGAAVVAMDLGSGVAHHWGDNYGLPRPATFDHTKWHTDVKDSNYCLIGFSNKALDKLGVWPAWEKVIHNVTGKTPVAWQVPAYKSFALGEIDKPTLQSELSKAGLK